MLIFPRHKRVLICRYGILLHFRNEVIAIREQVLIRLTDKSNSSERYGKNTSKRKPQNVLLKYNIKCSTTEQYAPYQNAITERINGIMKQEFLMNTKDLDIKTMGRIIKES